MGNKQKFKTSKDKIIRYYIVTRDRRFSYGILESK